MLTHTDALALAQNYQTPLFVYHRNILQQRADTLMELRAPFGLQPRYAVKANPHPEIIALFDAAGLHFDASSSYEATNLLSLGIAGHKIRLSSQQPAHNLPELLHAGVHFTATSLHQLQLFADASQKGSEVGLRVNPGIGSGHNNRTTTGGVSSSFGLWHEYLEQALQIAAAHQLRITTLHIHIGSGADPSAWGKTIDQALQIVAQMPDVTTLDIGGGYKVARQATEQETDLAKVMQVFSQRLRAFADKTGRQLALEIEPGTWAVAHAGDLLAKVVDIVDTGRDGYTFLRINTGMNDILRPTLYGAQHTITVLNDATDTRDYVVVGHNCESGDILTPMPQDPEHIQTRTLKKANIGDLIVMSDVGAYCASLRATGYNAFPSATEIVR